MEDTIQIYNGIPFKKVNSYLLDDKIYDIVFDSSGTATKTMKKYPGKVESYSSFDDYVPKLWDSSKGDFKSLYKNIYINGLAYLVPIYRESDNLQLVINNNVLHNKTLNADNKQSVIKKPLSQEVLPYLSHISNGAPFFHLPEGISNDDFLNAVKQYYLNNHIDKTDKSSDVVLYYNPNESNQIKTDLRTSRSNTINIRNNNISEGGEENVYLPKRSIPMYVYPHKKVDIYNIDPKVFEDVIKTLNGSNNYDHQDDEYYISPFLLLKLDPGQLLNDSTFHFIDKNGIHNDVPIFAENNKNLLAPLDIVSIIPHYIPQSYIKDNKVNLITHNGSDISFGYDNQNNSLAYPINSPYELFYQVDSIHSRTYPSLKTLDSLVKENMLSSDNVNQYANVVSDHPYLYASPVNNVDLVNSIPADNDAEIIEDEVINPFKQFGKKIQGLFKKETGGQLNYLKYFK